ncbi:MAG: putative esterase, partial [Bryobacterales bacterium]|nr:putative esterase [Bryobacterales bacterium]
MPLVLLLLACSFAARAGEPLILDQTHESQVFRETRHYRIFLPPDYATSGKRYPVIYWFHGWSERYNKPVAREPEHNYDEG